MARVLITGDRNWRCTEMAEAVAVRLQARYGPALVIVHGGAKGVDTAFEEACRLNEINRERHSADWEGLGPRAGPVRNQRMVEAGADICIAVHRDLKRSKGTRDCVQRCLKVKIPVYLINSDDAIPVRIYEIQ